MLLTEILKCAGFQGLVEFVNEITFPKTAEIMYNIICQDKYRSGSRMIAKLCSEQNEKRKGCTEGPVLIDL